MAVYNELQVGRYVRLIQKLFGIKGRQPAPLQFSGEIGAVLALMHGSENRYLEGWNLYGASINVPQVAANGSGIQLRNPGNSNVIAVFQKIVVAIVVTDAYTLSIGATGADLATPGSLANARFDARGSQTPNVILSTQNTVAGAVPALSSMIVTVRGLANVSYDLILTDDQEITLLPGDALRIAAQSINEQLTVSFMWRERALEDSELK